MNYVMLKKRVSKAIAGIAVSTGLLGTIGVAQAQDYGFGKDSLEWASRDHGFNEGGLCGMNSLQATAGVQVPNVPFEYQILGNVWDRTNMMGAAQAAFNLGYVDAAVNTAICSQAHNQPVFNYLAQNRQLIIFWFSHR
jgi:hypothetical protein